jgi:hypothetical protein
MESEFPQSVPVPVEYRHSVYTALSAGGMSNVAIGKATGVSEFTVRKGREISNAPKPPQVKELPSRKSVQVRQAPASGEPQREPPSGWPKASSWPNKPSTVPGRSVTGGREGNISTERGPGWGYCHSRVYTPMARSRIWVTWLATLKGHYVVTF